MPDTTETNAPLFIGLDLGTSQAKAVLVNLAGDIIAKASFAYSHLTDHPSAVEQDAEDWWQATCHLVHDLVDQQPAGTYIRALSYSTQGGSLVLTDAGGNPLQPAIIWSDQRGGDYRDHVLANFDLNYIYRKTGWSLNRGLHILHLLRLQAIEPELVEQARYFLSVPDFISLRLTGRPAIDCSNAGINQLMDIEQKNWDAPLLRFLNIKPGQLADIVESGQVIGQILPQQAEVLRIPKNTWIVSGAHDQMCAALGAGAIHNGDRLIGTGTAWVLMEIADQMPLDLMNRRAFSRHPLEGKWSSLLSLSSGGAALEWTRGILHLVQEKTGLDLTLPELDRHVEERLTKPDLPFFLPFLNGCPFPTGLRSLKAGFFGIDVSHDAFDLAAAVMEGVALQVTSMWEAFPQQSRKGPITMTGGASRSSVWRQLLANCLNQSIQILQEKDIGCGGAAILAGLGTGSIIDLDAVLKRLSSPAALIRPDPQNNNCYQRLQTFKRIRQAMSHV